MVDAKAFSYDAFASHATDPDGALVRAVEARLETFHTRHAVAMKFKRELELCVDGRDFVFSRRDRRSESGGDIIEPVVRSYQRQSRALVVFSGPSSRNHPWVGKEVEWWGEDRIDGPVYFALTHGTKPDDTAENMPEALLRRGGGDTVVFFDLRGYYRRRRSLWQSITEVEPERSRALRADARSWRSVRDFEEEVGKLAARLTCDAIGEEGSLDAIENSYVAAVRSERRWRRALSTVLGVAIVVAASLAGYWAHNAFEDQRRARVSGWIQQAEALSGTASADLVQGLAYAASAVHDGSDPRATNVLHRILRRLAPIDYVLSGISQTRQSEQTQTAALTSDGRFLITGGRDSILHVLDIANGRRVADFPLQAGRVRTIVPVEDGSALVIGTDRGVRYVRMTSTADGGVSLDLIAQALTGERIGGLTLDRARGQVIAGTFSGKIMTLPVTADDGTWPATLLLTILDPRYVAKGDTDVVSGIFGVQSRGDRLVVAGIDGVLTVLDWRGGKPVQRWQKVHPNSIFALDVTQDGTRIAVADDEGRLSIYDADKGAPREAQFRAIDPASLVRSIKGEWVVARADELPSVGVAFDPSGNLVAVTSHDRTVKFLLADELLPLAIAVHSAATRGVVFDQRTGAAYAFGDDGVVSAVRPLTRPLSIEIAQTGNVVVPNQGRLFVLWPTADRGRTRLFSFMLEGSSSLRPLATLDADIWNGRASDNGRIFLRAAASTKVHVLTPEGGPPCEVTTLDHPNEPDNVQIVRKLLPGAVPGEVTTVAERHGRSGSSVVRGWSTSTCRMVWRIELTAPSEQVAIAAGRVVAREAPKQVSVRDPQKPHEVSELEFRDDVAAIAALSTASRILVQTKSALCVCSPGRGGGSSIAPEACAAQSESHTCQTIGGSPIGEPLLIRKLFASPSGKFAVGIGDSAVIWLIDVERRQVREVAPHQLRPVEPPYAFDATDALLAVPAGDSGIRIVETATGKILAELPTPSRVMRLEFSGSDRLISIDGDVLRVWDWSREAMLREACKRWPLGVPVFNVTPRSRICDQQGSRRRDRRRRRRACCN